MRPIYNGIGFLPGLMCCMFFLLALFSIQLEQWPIDEWLSENAKWTQISEPETARSILGTIAGGIISLTVFSFSMVMVVLNQASSNFSPRLLPGLISDRRNQSVLGVYLGTIIYCMTLMFNTRAISNNYEVPSLAVLMGVMLMGLCLGLFIFFIHSISKSIQISEVLEDIYAKTKTYLKEAQKSGTELPSPHKILHHPLLAPTSGYLQDIRREALIKFCARHDLLLALHQIQGDFVMEGEILCYMNRELTDEKLIDTLQNHFVFYDGEWIADNYIYGFKHLSEVAVKALSPGINDPATAISVLNHLGVLLSKYLSVKEFNPFTDTQNKIRVVIRNHNLEDLLQRTLGPIRFYGKEDAHVMERLLWLTEKLCTHTQDEALQATLYHFANGVRDSAHEYIPHKQERDWLNRRFNSMNECLNDAHQLPLLHYLPGD